jgi:N-acetylmuramoyl-L-alanine amidase
MCLLHLHGETVGNSLKPVWINDIEYVNLERWSESKDFKFAWACKEEDIWVTNRWAKMSFKPTGRKVVINGVSVWLSHQVAVHGNACFLSQIDIKTALMPILFPKSPPKPGKIKCIMLDPGHGGRDPGNQDRVQKEKQYTLLLANEIRKKMSKSKVKVVLTRSEDAYIDLDQRPAIAKRQKADLFVSLHFNAVNGNGNGIRGVEVYCMPPPGARATGESADSSDAKSWQGNANDERNIYLAFQIQKAMVKGLGAEDRGVRRARWAVLRPAAMPAVLVEGGFMSDPEEGGKIYTSQYRRELAQAVVDGILAYKRWLER